MSKNAVYIESESEDERDAFKIKKEIAALKNIKEELKVANLNKY